MFTINTIISEGSDLVGWRQSQKSGRTTLNSNLTTSQTGIYVDALQGIDFDVIEDGLTEDYANVNDYLEAVHQDEIVNLMHQFTSNNKQKLKSRDLLNNFDVTNGVTDYTELETKNQRFVGWVIKPHFSNNIEVEITSLGLQLSDAQTLKLYLYETSQQDPIETYEFSYTQPLSLQWKDVSWTMSYRGNYGTRQQYILGYYETDSDESRDYPLTGEAVKFEFDCGCGNSPKKYFGRYVEINPVEFPSADLSGTTLPDLDDITGNYTSHSYGLYAKINVRCDITDVIVDNIDVFAKAYQYMIAVRILEDFLASKRINPTVDSRINRDFVEYAKNVHYNTLWGWTDSTNRYHRGLMDDLSIDFSGIDNICLPPDKAGLKTGYIRYRGKGVI